MNVLDRSALAAIMPVLESITSTDLSPKQGEQLCRIDYVNDAAPIVTVVPQLGDHPSKKDVIEALSNVDIIQLSEQIGDHDWRYFISLFRGLQRRIAAQLGLDIRIPVPHPQH